MKHQAPTSNIQTRGRATGLQLASAAGESITIAGQTFRPDHGTAYAEFYLSHAFPVFLDVPERGEEADRLAVHPQTVANSYRSLRGKVVNLCHMMVVNDPENILADKILGTVMAVEFGSYPDGALGSWQLWPGGELLVQGDPNLAPGIRVVAALHKNAVGVKGILDTWAQGKTVFGNTKWTVSIESLGYVEQGGFLLKDPNFNIQTPEKLQIPNSNLQTTATPEDFRALGWVYVPYLEAPADLRACLNTTNGFGIIEEYAGCQTLFLNGGLNGEILYFGVALTPLGKESRARVARMNASALTPEDLKLAEGLNIIGNFLDRLKTKT